MAGKVTLSCLLALSIAVANGLTGGLLGSSTTNACVASSTCVPSYKISSPSVFGDLPLATSTNQPPVQSVLSIKGGTGIAGSNSPVAGTPGICSTYQSPYITLTGNVGYQVTVQGIVVAIYSDYFIIQNSTGAESVESRPWSGMTVYIDGVTAYNGPSTIGQQVLVSGNPYPNQGGMYLVDGWSDGVQTYNGGAQSPWGFGDAANTPTGQYPLQVTLLNAGAVVTQPAGYPGGKTGWFTGICGNTSMGISESLRNVRTTFTNVMIMSLESSTGYVILNDGSGNMTMNSQIIGLNQVAGLCGFAPGDSIASITLLPKWSSNGAGSGAYELYLTQVSDVGTPTVAKPVACYPSAFVTAPAVQSIASLDSALGSVSGTCNTFSTPYGGLAVAVSGIVTSVYTPVFGFPDYASTVGYHVMTLQDSTNKFSGATYSLSSDANACPVGTGAAGFCGSVLKTGTYVTVTGGTPQIGAPGVQLQTDVGALYVTSNGSAPALPAPIAITTGTFVSTCTAAAEPYRYMRITNARVVATLQNVTKKGITTQNRGLIVDDGSGAMYIGPSPSINQHLAGQADVFFYLNATTPGGIQVGDVISQITGVIVPWYFASANYSLIVPSPQPIFHCDNDYRSCGPIQASDIGTVTRNGAVLASNPAGCTPAVGCFLYNGVTANQVAPPPPPVTLAPIVGSVMTKVTTPPAGAACSSTDSCFLFCSAKVSSGTIDGTSGGNYAYNMVPGAGLAAPSGCACPTDCVASVTHSKPSDPVRVAIANAEVGGLTFTCSGGGSSFAGPVGAVVTVSGSPTDATVVSPTSFVGSNTIVVAWSNLTASAASAASTTCAYAVTSGSMFAVNVATSVPVAGSISALNVVSSSMVLAGVTGQAALTPAALGAFTSVLGTSLSVDPNAIVVTSSYASFPSGRRSLLQQSGLRVFFVVVTSTPTNVTSAITGLGSTFVSALNDGAPIYQSTLTSRLTNPAPTGFAAAGVAAGAVTSVTVAAPSTSTGAAAVTAVNTAVLAPVPPSPPPVVASTSSPSKSTNHDLAIGLGVGLGGGVFLICCFVAIYFGCLRKKVYEKGQKSVVVLSNMPSGGQVV